MKLVASEDDEEKIASKKETEKRKRIWNTGQQRLQMSKNETTPDTTCSTCYAMNSPAASLPVPLPSIYDVMGFDYTL